MTDLTHLEALLARVPNYHGRVMNSGRTAHMDMSQKLAARDARHDAAEIAVEADGHIADLADALRTVLAEVERLSGLLDRAVALIIELRWWAGDDGEMAWKDALEELSQGRAATPTVASPSVSADAIRAEIAWLNEMEKYESDHATATWPDPDPAGIYETVAARLTALLPPAQEPK